MTFFLLFSSITFSSAVANTLERTLLSESKFGDTGGRCGDGSMAGYYYGPPSSGKSKLWVIEMQGGGACEDKVSCQVWMAKKGSSNNWKSTLDTTNILLATDADRNPDFHDAHHIHIPYCTGDVHGGQVTKPTSQQWGLYFSGHLNFKAILDTLRSTMPAVQQMDRILLTGGSAGGIGTLKNCDFLQSYLNESGILAKVSCAPNAGWFFPGFAEDQTDPDNRPSFWADWSQGSPTPDVNRSVTDLWQSYLSPACTQAYAKDMDFHCDTAHALYPHIQAPVYVMENQYDTNQLEAQLGLSKTDAKTDLGHGYIAYFGRSMRNSTHQVVKHPLGKTGDGLFLPSCFQHGVQETTTKLNGFSALEGLGDWFFGRGKVPTVLVDNCTMEAPGLPCNPTCPNAPSPGPSPSPSPPGACEAALKSACGRAIIGQGAACATCAKAHRPELAKAGCTVKEVTALCEGSIIV